MSDAKKKKKRPPRKPSTYWDGFDPKPTVFKGGIKRMVEIFHTLRDQNAGGYGSGVIQKIGGWPSTPQNVTSCSPFTATVIGMLMDPSGVTKGDFQPMYDGGTKPLPRYFYDMHQQNFFSFFAEEYARFKKNGWAYCNDSATSVQFFNLGYPVKAKDLRRGDLVGIDWSNGGGHAVIVWDVHLDDKGEVDAFCFISANGGEIKAKKAKAADAAAPAAAATPAAKPKRQFHGAGVTIAGCDGAVYGAGKKTYLSGKAADKNLAAAETPLFQDREAHIYDAHWYVVPRKTRKDIDKATFKHPGARGFIDSTGKYTYARSLKAARLWGIHPPDRPAEDGEAAIFDRAKQLAYEHAPDSYATGKGKPPAVHVERVPVVVHKGPPEKAKASPPAPAKQHAERPAPHQNFVEAALQKLHGANWLTTHPGNPKDVNDAESKKAIREFQEKFHAPPIDGIAGPITRKALRKALDDLDDGKPPPGHAPAPKKPRLDRVAWLRNRVNLGEPAFLSVHGQDLDEVTNLHITLKDRKSGVQEKLAWECVLVNNVGVTPVVFPAAFKRGAEVLATFSGSVGGTQLTYEHKVPMYIGTMAPPPSDDWPWDEALWTQRMRDIIADLRATPKPSGTLEQWEITQYGVKEKMDPGEIEVKSASGEVFGTTSLDSLIKADIEGTMRLGGRILNITKAGNVYEPVEKVVGGVKVIKRKPNRAKFDPANSLWTDVTRTAPWGAGAKMPLVPFRTLALNPNFNREHFFKRVYIKQLDGMKMPNGEVHNGMCIAGDVGGMRAKQFDLFVGREDAHIKVPSVGGRGGTIVELEILGDSAASRPGKKKKK